MAGFNNRLRLTIEDGSKVDYYEKVTLELRNDVLQYIVDIYSSIQERFESGKNVFYHTFLNTRKKFV